MIDSLSGERNFRGSRLKIQKKRCQKIRATFLPHNSESCSGYVLTKNESGDRVFVLASGLGIAYQKGSVAYYAGSKNLEKRPVETCNTDKGGFRADVEF